MNNDPTLFERLSALADPMRSRMLLVLERHELTVSELASVFQLPQSTTSRHLKALSDDGWLVWRAEGTSRRYRMPADELDAPAARLWALLREQTAALAEADQDEQRVRGVLAERRSRSREFFSTASAEWDHLRDELFGAGSDLLGLLALLDPRWVVGDLGCGTGQLAASLAPFVRRVIAMDESPEMLAAARERLRPLSNVEVRRGELEALPVEGGALDVAVLSLVLPYVAEPERALHEASRALRPGGRLLVVDMMPHGRDDLQQRMGHLWPGFAAEQLRGWTQAAGLGRFHYQPLPADPAAKGPTLFAATGTK